MSNPPHHPGNDFVLTYKRFQPPDVPITHCFYWNSKVDILCLALAIFYFFVGIFICWMINVTGFGTWLEQFQSEAIRNLPEDVRENGRFVPRAFFTMFWNAANILYFPYYTVKLFERYGWLPRGTLKENQRTSWFLSKSCLTTYKKERRVDLIAADRQKWKEALDLQSNEYAKKHDMKCIFHDDLKNTNQIQIKFHDLKGTTVYEVIRTFEYKLPVTV